MKKLVASVLCVTMLALGACSDGDDDESPTTAPTGGPSGTATTSAPAGGEVSVDTDFGDDGVLLTALSEDTNDRFMAVAFDESGSFYATGFVSDAGDHAMVVAKFNEDGSPDESFGDDGTAVVNVASGGKTAEISRAVAVQEDGKIVIAGPVEHDTSATGDAAKDTDVAIVRFNEDGTLDGNFGEEGIAIIDLSTGRQVSENTFLGDNSWGLGATDSGVVVLGSALAEGDGRTDSDLVLFAVDDTGALDEAFGDDGKVVIDIDQATLNPRSLTVEDDGAIMATGYGNLGGVVQPVLIRVSSTGSLDESFGDRGIATAAVLPGVAESYAFARQGDHYISVGYGRGADATEKVDMVVDRWTSDGTLDESFGDGGVTRLDLADQDDRARNVIVLPGNQILAVGSGKLTEPEVDGLIALFDEDGAPVESFGEDGHVLRDLGGPADAFYGVALAPDGKSIIVAGYKGVATDSGDNDDALLARLVIE